MELLRLVF